MSSGAAGQLLMLGAEALLVSLLLLGLFRLRSRFGLTPLSVTLGVFQPIQVLLASSIYVEILPGLVISPGSAVMFTAALFAILLVYIREDALEARKVIYGIAVANLGMTLLMLVFGAQLTLPGTLNLLGLPREVFNQGARVMVAGTLALCADVLLIIVVFEAVWRFTPRALFLRIFLTMAIVLVFDTLVFATGAFYGQPHFGAAVLSGIVGKVGMATLYAAVLTLFLRFGESDDSSGSAIRKPLQDIFSVLTYRQKYELERDAAEEVLRESEARFQAIFNATNDAIFVHDPETGAIVDVNRKMCEMFAMTREEALRADVGDISSGIPPYTQEAALGWLRKAAAGEPQLFEWRSRDKAGRLFWVEVNMRCATIGAAERVIVSVREITERKRAEDELRVIYEELLAVNRIIVTCASTMSAVEILDKVMDEALRITGLEGGTICYVTPEETLQIAAHRATSEATIEDLTTHAVKVGDCLCGECARDRKPLILADRQAVLKYSTREAARGEDIRFHAAFPLVAGERCVGVLCVFTRTDAKPSPRSLKLLDTVSAQIALAIENARLYAESLELTTTLEKKVQERTAELTKAKAALLNLVDDLNSANGRLQELDRLKSMFIASMSHELRTPLNSIIGFSGIMLQGLAGELNREQRDQLERVFRAGKHLLSLITDVIDIAKIESGKIQAYAEEFVLQDLVREACESLKVQLKDRGLELRVDIPEAPVRMNTDRRRLLQCLLNYLGNAVKFTEAGSIAVSAGLAGESVTISVTDTGIGIRASDIGLLFTSFVRLDSPLKMTTPGTGLGLYLTKKLVTEVLGGAVHAESREGAGSTFSLTIPRILPAAGEQTG